MIAQHIGHVAALDDVQRAKARVAGLRAAQPLPEEALVGRPEPDLVHGQIGFAEPVHVKMPGVREIGLPQRLQLGIDKAHALRVRWGAGEDEIAQHHGLDRDALIDELVDDVVVKPGDDAALARDDLHQAVLLQALQDAAHRRAGEGKALAQIVLAEQIAGLVLKAQNLQLERLEDLLVVGIGLGNHRLLILAESDDTIINAGYGRVNTV